MRQARGWAGSPYAGLLSLMMVHARQPLVLYPICCSGPGECSVWQGITPATHRLLVCRVTGYVAYSTPQRLPMQAVHTLF